LIHALKDAFPNAQIQNLSSGKEGIGFKIAEDSKSIQIKLQNFTSEKDASIALRKRTPAFDSGPLKEFGNDSIVVNRDLMRELNKGNKHYDRMRPGGAISFRVATKVAQLEADTFSFEELVRAGITLYRVIPEIEMEPAPRSSDGNQSQSKIEDTDIKFSLEGLTNIDLARIIAKELSIIETATEQWIIENKKDVSTKVQWENLAKYFRPTLRLRSQLDPLGNKYPDQFELGQKIQLDSQTYEKLKDVPGEIWGKYDPTK